MTTTLRIIIISVINDTIHKPFIKQLLELQLYLSHMKNLYDHPTPNIHQIPNLPCTQ